MPILLWAGAGFSLSRHYCLGMLIEESFYIEAESCSNEELHHNDFAEKSKGECDVYESTHLPCCNDEWISVASVQVESAQSQNEQSKQENSPSSAPKALNECSAKFFDKVLAVDYIYTGPPEVKGELNPELSQYLAEIQSYLI